MTILATIVVSLERILTHLTNNVRMTLQEGCMSEGDCMDLGRVDVRSLIQSGDARRHTHDVDPSLEGDDLKEDKK